MGSEVRAPLTVEETGPHFNHCHISDIWNNMSGSGDRVGLVGSDLVRVVTIHPFSFNFIVGSS